MAYGVNLSRAGCRRRAADFFGGLPRRRQRGFVHVLLLVFTVLGVSLWGITEMLHRSQEATQKSEQKHSEAMTRARRALLNYAVLAPERLSVERRAGRYNAFWDGNNRNPYNLTEYVPHRYFAMPCPDSARDGNWDGASDSLVMTTVGIDIAECGNFRGGIYPGDGGSRVGRLPWRTELGEEGGRYLYIRGLGEDLVDRHGDRFWYAAAYNLLRNDRALNPHWLLRQTQGWIALAENGEDGTAADGEYIRRVAGVVVSPGIYGGSSNPSSGRIPEVGAVPVTLSQPDLRMAVNGYLDIDLSPTTLCSFGFSRYSPSARNSCHNLFADGTVEMSVAARINDVIYYNNPSQSRSDDRLAYITAEDLASHDGEGVQLMLENSGNIMDMAAGEEGFFGVKDVMRSHFDRYGSLPPPAAFNKAAGESPVRPQGVGGGGAWVGNTVGVTVTAVLPIKNIRRVYLQPGAVLSAEDANFYGDALPPYNLALYAMDTSFNTAPMAATVRALLMAQDIYPRDNLLGFRRNITTFSADSDAVRTVGDARAPLDARVYLKQPPPLRDVEFSGLQRMVSGLSVPMALAEPALAYILGDGLADVVDADGFVPSESPQYGVQVQLPTGTRFTIIGEPLNPVSLFLRGGISAPPAEYNITDRRWTLTRQWEEPVLLDDNSDRMITITAVLHDSPVQAGGIGFFPVNDVRVTVGTDVEYYDPESGYFFSPASTVSPVMPGSDFHGHVNSGVRRARYPISVLPEELRLFTAARLVVAPFPPPGRPALNRMIGHPDPLYVNYFGNIGGEVDGYRSGVEFSLPANTRIFYPSNVAINLGADFQFPPGTRAFLPPGAVMSLESLPGTTLPDGRESSASMGSTVTINGTILTAAAVQTLAVTLVHGGMMDLSGPVGNNPAVAITLEEGARIALRDGRGIGSSQELFDIEMHSIGGITLPGETGDRTHFRGGILQPLAARGIFYSIQPPQIDSGTNTTLSISTWTRAQFLSRPQYVTYYGTSFQETLVLTATATTTPALPETESTLVSPFLVSIVALSGSRAATVELLARVGETTGTIPITVQLTISEQTQFMLPPGEYTDYFSGFTSLPSVTAGLGRGGNFAHTEVVFPVGSGFYDPGIPTLDGFAIGGVSGWPVLATPLTLTLAEALPTGNFIASQLVMFLDSDTNPVDITRVVGGDAITISEPLPAGSAVDLLHGYSFRPGAIPVRQVAAGEVGAVSAGEIYLYFSEPVTLTNRGVFEVVGRYQGSENTLEVKYTPPVSVSINYAAVSSPSELQSDTAVTATISILDSEEGEILAGDSFVLPAGSFIIVPRGGTLDFLSQSKSLPSVVADNSDFVVLPENSVAGLPPGTVLTIINTTATITLSTESGLGYLRFQSTGGGMYALVDHPDYMGASPLVYYSEDTYLTGLAGLRSNPGVGTRIAAGSHGDLFGMIYSRYKPDYETNLLPADTSEFLRNYPMVYAVAPNCRSDMGGGENCAENDRGLEFTVGAAERVELEHELIARGNILITLVSELADNLQFRVTVRTPEQFYTVPESTLTMDFDGRRSANSAIIRGTDGRVEMFQGTGRVGDFETGNIVQVAIPADAPSDTVLRVYMDLPTSRFADLTSADFENAHFAEVRALTIYSGGWTMQENVADAAGKITVTVTTATPLPDMQLGYGAQIGGNLENKFVFGRGGYIGMGTYRLPLDRYQLARTFDYQLGFYPESIHTEVDFAGNVLSQIQPGERVVVEDGNAQAFTQNAGTVATVEVITLTTTTPIAMAPGYLWQGYMSGERITMGFQENVASTLAGFRNRAFLRVHPQDERLNFWGSGQEKAEGLDGRSIAAGAGNGERLVEVDGWQLTAGVTLFDGGAVPPRHIPTNPTSGAGIIGPVSPYLTELIAETIAQVVYVGDVGTGMQTNDQDFRHPTPGGHISRTPVVEATTAFGATTPSGRGSGAYGSGFRSPLAVGGDITMRARVRDSAGEIVSESLDMVWTPQYRALLPGSIAANGYLNIAAASDTACTSGISQDDDTFPDCTHYGWFAWGAGNAPFYLPDQSYLNDDDIWAGRIRAAYDPATVIVSITIAANLSGILPAGGTVAGVFDMPQFQMRGINLRRPRAVSYPDSADILIASLTVRGCPDDTSGDATAIRVPGLILGHWADVERRRPGTGENCTNNDARLPSFSSRPRRNAGVDAYASLISVTVVSESRMIRSFNRERNLLDDSTAIFIAEPGVPEVILATLTMTITTDPIRGSLAPPFRQTRVTLPTITVALDDYEVIGARNSDPTIFNLGRGAVTLGFEDPESYVVSTINYDDSGVRDGAGVSSLGTLTVGTARELVRDITTTVSVPLYGDAMFYMDRTYRADGFGAGAQQMLELGDDFKIVGPGALVPHFGGRNLGAVADVYAARSRMMYALFADDPDGMPDGTDDDDKFKLHNVYSRSNGGGSCPSSETSAPRDIVCPAMNSPENAPFWIPIISGIVAFDGVDITLESGAPDGLEDIFLVMPQPQAVAVDAGSGNTVTIYGGSIIHPISGEVRMARPITADSTLVLLGDAVAAVDVSPAAAPTPVQMIRDDTLAMRGWDFNFPPIEVSEGTVTYIVEPLGFTEDDVIDFTRISTGVSRTDLGDSTPPVVCSNNNVGIFGANCRLDTSVIGNLFGTLPNRRISLISPAAFRITTHYDGTATRGFLMDDRMSDIMADYYTAAPVFVTANLFTTYFPRRDYGTANATLSVYHDEPPEGNHLAPVGNPLSWHWMHRMTGGSFIPMGGSRQFHLVREARGPSVIDGVDPGCEGGYPQSADIANSTVFAEIPCAGPDSHYWVGVFGGSSSTSHETNDDEFLALRLPHAISIPHLTETRDAETRIPIRAHRGDPTPNYPTSVSSFFQFPPGSEASILQVDAASWESVHPYAARYMPGAIFANDGGVYPATLPATTGDLDTLTDQTRRLLRTAEEMRVPENNDGIRRVDVGGRRVLHYANTESAPGDYPRSNAPVYTNVWIKLVNGGYLQDASGDIINLPVNTVVNPVLGTYLPGDRANPIARELTSNYQAYADIERGAEIARPALIIPPGATVQVSERGARIADVKAAAIFSLTPLDNISCASGGISGGEFAIDGLSGVDTVSQEREGVSESNYSGGDFTIGHPCAWLDDPENTDGDRVFVYRSRRRYLEPYKTRILSNDRTYLLGGRLELL